jgi:predicted AAA+ superfamily ATPase
MAISNRDRIGRTFELMAPALDDFIGRSVASGLPEGAPWTTLVARKDEKRGIKGREYHALDPQLQLRMLTENIPDVVEPGWRPFDDAIGRVGQGYCKELRDARNEWAHNKSFSDDDAYRCLDTAERLLIVVGGPAVAEEVRAIRLGLRRLTADKDDRRALKSAAATPGSEGLRPWREVLAPHDDVATGNFQAAEFAADLHKVAATGDADKDYAEPVQFFSRTYLTEGLRDLVGRAMRRLAGDLNASPVINLQTNFGGGKTHSMLALWHLASGTQLGDYPQELQELLSDTPYRDLSGPIRRVALVGNHISPSGEVKPDGTQVNTIWGELAWQLGGKAAFSIVETADSKRTPPGQALHELLRAYAPAVILIDEWVAYARSLVARDDLAGGTFDDQFTFAQSLTEAVKGTPGVLLAVSIPASESGDDARLAAGNAEEVGGAHGLEALRRLQNVVGRVADQWRPASPPEAYHIVRQRLFTAPDADALASINATARSFVEMYHRYADEFPRETRDGSYEDRIKQTYPIHPELFDRLYEDWSSLERFQRTRGVLRLMNTIIRALWVGEDQSPLIMPGSIPIGTAAVNSELTQYLQDSWKAVIDADVDGPNAEPLRIDASKPLFGQRSLTRRLARTVFFGSAPTIGSAHKGLETQHVFLGTATPGDVPGNFHSALAALADRATYFYSAGGRYWYDLQANISRRAKDQAERLPAEAVYGEIVRRLKDQAKARGGFARVHVCPEDTADIPDIDEARLVILHPRLTHGRREGNSDAIAFARDATEHRGALHRTYRNMLVYLAGDRDRLEELERSIREYLAWSDIVAKEDDLNLFPSQRNQATERMAKAHETTEGRLLGVYQWALVPTGQPVELQVTKVEGQAASLAERVSRRLRNDGALADQHVAAAIRHQLDTALAKRWASGHVTVGELWGLYAEYPYMPRLRDRGVLDAGLSGPQLLWEQEGFALAEGFDETYGQYRGLVLPTDGVTFAVIDATLIVAPERAEGQRARELPAARPSAGASDAESEADAEPVPGSEPGGAPQPQEQTRFFGSKRLQSDRYASDFKKLADEVLGPLGATPGVELSVTIEIEATAPAGFDDAKVRTVSENATTLKFEQSGFEEG